jgi:hypothetical protein
MGQRNITLESPLIRDGLAIAGGRIYASARNGRIYCVGFE